MKQAKQLELNNVPRVRRALIEDTATAREGEQESSGEFSPWVKFQDQMPPVTGNWDVRDVARKLATVRVTFDAETQQILLPNWPFPLVMWGAEWRGLSKPPTRTRVQLRTTWD